MGASSACLFCTVGHSALPSSSRHEVLFAPRLVASGGADFLPPGDTHDFLGNTQHKFLIGLEKSSVIKVES